MCRRIFVTGGTGMLGTSLLRRLLADSQQVFLFARGGTCIERFRDASTLPQLLTGDITDAHSVTRAVESVNPDVVYHLASTPFNPPTIRAETHLEVVVRGTLNLLEALVSFPNARIVHIGSAAEYGSGSYLREDQLPRPGTILGAAKTSATVLMQTYARLHNLQTVILRLFTPFGPWESPKRLIPYTILSALGGRDVVLGRGTQQRDYCYVDDVVEALILAGTCNLEPGTVLNICSGQGRPILQVVETILNLMGSHVRALAGVLPTRSDEIWEMSGDIAVAHSLLGWEPKISFEDGLRKTIEWFSSNPDFAQNLS